MEKEKLKKYLPILVFVFTVALGLASIFLSYRMQRLKARLPGIFQGDPYETPGPETPGPETPGPETPTPGPETPGPCDPPPCGANQYIVDNCCQDCVPGECWCCGPCDDDDDDDDDDTPTPSPTPTPSQPPPGECECVDLGPEPSDPQVGEELEFRCDAYPSYVTIDHYNFRVFSEGAGAGAGSVIATETVTTSDWSAYFNFTVPATGAPFKVQCQVCISSDNSDCTVWGQAE